LYITSGMPWKEIWTSSTCITSLHLSATGAWPNRVGNSDDLKSLPVSALEHGNAMGLAEGPACG
jgi:hypothetical protein